MMPLSICVRVLLTFLRAPLKNKNEVMVISHALAQLHAVDDNLQGTLQDHQDDRLGVPIRLVESLLIDIRSTESRCLKNVSLSYSVMEVYPWTHLRKQH